VIAFASRSCTPQPYSARIGACLDRRETGECNQTADLATKALAPGVAATRPRRIFTVGTAVSAVPDVLKARLMIWHDTAVDAPTGAAGLGSVLPFHATGNAPRHGGAIPWGKDTHAPWNGHPGLSERHDVLQVGNPRRGTERDRGKRATDRAHEDRLGLAENEQIFKSVRDYDLRGESGSRWMEQANTPVVGLLSGDRTC
jgi:hypothetical protein